MITTEEVWTDYRTSLQSFLLSKISRREDAEDLLQDILLKTHLTLHTVKDDGNVKAWLMQVANREIIDFYRRGRRKTEELSDEGVWWDMHDVEVERSFARCARPFLRALPDDAAQLLEAVDLEGRSQRDVATDLGVSYSTIKSRVQRARHRLRKVAYRCCDLEVDGRGKVIDFTPRSKTCEGC